MCIRDSDINNHVPAAALGMLAIVLVLDIIRKQEQATRWQFVLVGIVLGLLPTIDIPSSIMSVGLGGWLITRADRRALQIALPLSLIPIAAHMWITFSYSGSVLPVQMNAAAWERKPGGARIPRWIYFFHSTLGLRCLLYTSPSPRDATLSRMPSSA